jgi:FtsP/CotA-like multicopper oxidase with cupredoxin domain
MAGLVLGITVSDDEAEDVNVEFDNWLHLVAREKPSGDSAMLRGYALAKEGEPLPEGFQGPGPPIVLTRGEITRITISNEMREPTTVHWHGMELRSMYDGVAGWSGSQGRLAPLVTSNSPFDAYLKPPRAGTFIYHTHMDETEQLRSGLYGPLIVLEPGQSFDPETDLVFVIGDAIDGDYAGVAINGRRYPDPIELRVDTTYRIRIIDIGEAATVDVSFVSNSETLSWHALAKDGATLPSELQQEVRSEYRMGVGETFDFAWRPSSPMTAALEFDWTFATDPGHLVLRQQIVVE